MPTSAADIGVEASNYHGDPNLGGGNAGVINIDTKPLQNLAYYTYEQNKAMYEQSQKEMEANAKQLADLTAYDLTTAIPGDREKIQKGYDDLYNYVRNDPTVLDYKGNEKGWLEYNKKKNEFENQLSSGKVRSVLYAKRQEEATSDTRPGMKEYLQKTLDDEAKSTDIMTPLKHTQLYDIAPVSVTAPGEKAFDLTDVGANFYGTRTFKVWDQAGLNSQASQLALGFSKGLDETSADFINKSDSEKELIRSQAKVQSASGKLEPVESAKNISEVLRNKKYEAPEFRNADGSLNIDAVIKDQSGNKLVSGVLTTIKQYNDKMHEMKAGITAGYFKDKFGGQLSFGGGGLNENDYSDIDLKDGLTAEEIIKPRILALANPIDYTTKITQGGLGIEKQRVAIAQGQLAETIRNNKADDKRIRDIANLPYEKAKLGTTDAAGNPIDFGNIIYGVRSTPGKAIRINKADGSKISDVSIKNGVVVDKNGDVVDYTGDIKVPASFLDNSIVTQFNKYQGATKVNPDGTSTVNQTPSKLLTDANGKYTLRMVNGTIEGIQTEAEVVAGEDNTKGVVPGTFATSNQFEDITLKAGQLGATKYKKPNPELGKLTDAQKFQNRKK